MWILINCHWLTDTWVAVRENPFTCVAHIGTCGITSRVHRCKAPGFCCRTANRHDCPDRCRRRNTVDVRPGNWETATVHYINIRVLLWIQKTLLQSVQIWNSLRTEFISLKWAINYNIVISPWNQFWFSVSP